MKAKDEIPEMLGKPLELHIDFLWASIVLELRGPEALREDRRLQSAFDDQMDQFFGRVGAACAYFGIDATQLGANFWPVVKLIVHAFPKAFKVIDEGAPKKPRKMGPPGKESEI